MKYWLTTHYPHPDPDRLPWHIYLQRQHKRAVAGIAVGDPVLFYEYKYQKPVKGEPKHPVGRQGIVRLARVSGAMYHRETVLEYEDGRVAYWSWGVPANDSDILGFVSRKDLLPVINYKPRSVLFGFNGGTGVMELDEMQFNELLRMFNKGNTKR